MTLRHLYYSLGAYAAAFSLAWAVTWIVCEFNPVSPSAATTAIEQP